MLEFEANVMRFQNGCGSLSSRWVATNTLYTVLCIKDLLFCCHVVKTSSEALSWETANFAGAPQSAMAATSLSARAFYFCLPSLKQVPAASRQCRFVRKHCHNHSNCYRTIVSDLRANNPNVDLEKLFLSEPVQSLLKRITGFDFDRIFRDRPVKEIQAPQYKFMTEAQLKIVSKLCTLL